MDYEKKYKQALEKAKSFNKRWQCVGATNSELALKELKEIFPELRGDEDEKIRKGLIEFVKSRLAGFPEYDEYLAWLEKQGEQPSAIRWYDVSLIPQEMEELLVEWDSEDATWHEIAFYHADTKTFWNGTRQVENVTRWCYIIDLLEKQGEQKPTSDTRYEVKAGGSLSVNGKPFDYEKATITQKDFEQKDYHDIDPHFGIPIEDLMSKENPIDKYEPKFHKGEWIVWKNKCYEVNYNGCGYELIDQNGLSTALEYGTVDTSARLYDVTKDAKDGDVLISRYGNPLIYNGNYNSLNIGAYCGMTCDDNKFKVAEEKCHWTENVDIEPATKEQCDMLFSKMEEAGYQWDAENKRLKKTEDEIEIPFGAKDSELQEVTYYIPKGFHAEINDDKVVIKKGEKSAEWSDEDELVVLSIEQVIKCASFLNLVPEGSNPSKKE